MTRRLEYESKVSEARKYHNEKLQEVQAQIDNVNHSLYIVLEELYKEYEDVANQPNEQTIDKDPGNNPL